MAEVFFLEHKNVEVRVEALSAEKIALELGTSRYILTPSEAVAVAEMLTDIMKWSAEESDAVSEIEDYHIMDEEGGEEPEWGWDEDIYEKANPRRN
jgi:hypothetical protein